MLKIDFSREFNKDFKKIEKTGRFKPSLKDVLSPVLSDLIQQKTLPEKYRDHLLKGDWHGFRECHAAPDLLLVYRVFNEKIKLVRLTSHAELF